MEWEPEMDEIRQQQRQQHKRGKKPHQLQRKGRRKSLNNNFCHLHYDFNVKCSFTVTSLIYLCNRFERKLFGYNNQSFGKLISFSTSQLVLLRADFKSSIKLLKCEWFYRRFIKLFFDNILFHWMLNYLMTWTRDS